MERARPEGKFPPGVQCYRKEPLAANPLFQVVLPTGFRHEGKQSRGVSFAEGDNLFSKKGTSRTQSQAEMVCMSWAWTWWESLTSEQRSAIQSSLAEPASKKRKQ